MRGDELLDALLRHRPALVHFAGHGDQAGQLILEDAAGRAAPVQPDALAALVAAADTVRCAVLNACWSDALADALLGVTACVVGMAGEVGDEAAIAFAAGFYRALADGETVAAAVAAGEAQACAESRAAGELLAPRLRAAPGVDPGLVRLYERYRSE
ncbi:MAG: CHAT domain-containing protein [Anaerolineae bacterium]